jgi:dihydroxy-acid dehydratase
VGHISPEAAAGGPIALIAEGDTIRIDLPRKRITLEVDRGELGRRKKEWRPPEPKIKHGYAYRYAKQVSSASTRAILTG